MSRAPTPRTVGDQITTLLTRFTLTTAARELVARFVHAEQQPALPLLLNVLAFGLPGVGKSHWICAVGHALVDRGHPVLFMPTYSLVQELLAAKRNLELPRALRKLDQFAVLILDDVGYIQQSPEEAEILF